jgi:hypothetical protein
MVLANRAIGGQSALALVDRATGRAATGLVRQTFGLEEFLLTDGEQKVLAAVTARKGLVRQVHSANPPFRISVSR